MPRDKVKQAAYNKQYRIENKERVRQYNIDNAEKRKQSVINRAEAIKEAQDKWQKNNPEKLKKTNMVSRWKAMGIKGDLSFIYDCAYITATHCWVCKSAFKSTHDRCCDHNHDTGEFRNVLCRACNMFDRWENQL